MAQAVASYNVVRVRRAANRTAELKVVACAIALLVMSSRPSGGAPSTDGLALTGTVVRGDRPVVSGVELRRVTPGTEDAPGGDSPYERWLRPLAEVAEPVQVAATDERGRFELRGVVPGDYELLARPVEGAPARQRLHVDPRAVVQPIRVLLPQGAETLRGSALLKAGQPLTGWVAATRVTSGPRVTGVPTATVVSALDSRGQFELRDLETGPHVLVFTRPGLHLGGIQQEVPTASSLNLVLGDALSPFTGRIVDDRTGKPVPGAHVVVLSRWPDGRRHAISSTNASAAGDFQLEAGPRPTGLDVTAPGYAGRRLALAGERHADVGLSALGAVQGVVQSTIDGRPVRGAVVHLLPSSPSPWSRALSAVTSDDGRFRITGAEPGWAQCFVLGGGSCSVDLTGRFNSNRIAEDSGLGGLRVLTGETPSVVLPVESACRLSGSVFDARGAPVAGARLDLAENSWLFEGTALQRAFRAAGGAVSASDGTFSLDAPPREAFVLKYEAQGMPLIRSEEIATVPEGVSGLRLEFPPRRELRVRVRCDEDGSPIRDAEVRVKLHWTSGRDGLYLPAAWYADSSGVAIVGPLPAGRLELYAEANRFLQPNWVDLKPERGSGADELEVRLSRGLGIGGVVVRPEHMPARAVSLEARDPYWPEFTRWVQPDDQGAFEQRPIGPGKYQLRARAEWDGKSWMAEAEVPAGTMDARLVLVEVPAAPPTPQPPAPAPAPTKAPVLSWSLRVVDGAGAPVSGAKLIVRERDARGGETALAQTYLEAGTAVIEAQAQGARVYVEVSRPCDAGGRSLPLAAAEVGPLAVTGGAITITLPPEREIVGTAVDEEGRPVSGIVVVAVPKYPPASMIIQGHFHAMGASDAMGNFRLGGVAERDYSLGVHARPSYVGLEAPAVRPGTTPVRFVVRRLITVRILCVDEANEPVRGVSVFLTRDDGTWDPGSDHPRATTDARGTAFLKGLDATQKYSLGLVAKSEVDLAYRDEDWTPKDTRAVLRAR